MSLNLQIIMPSKIVFKDDVNEVTIPTGTGQISILPGHIGLLSSVTEGEIIIKKQGKEYYVGVTGGYLEVNKNNVCVLADYAVRSEDIEIAKVHEAQKRAKKLMEEKVSEKDFAIIQNDLRRSILELKVATRRKHHSIPTP